MLIEFKKGQPGGKASPPIAKDLQKRARAASPPAKRRKTAKAVPRLSPRRSTDRTAELIAKYMSSMHSVSAPPNAAGSAFIMAALAGRQLAHAH